MSLKFLDHVNIRTARLADMTAFYRDVLGLEVGPRPPFGAGGAWLYTPNGRAALHLVEVPKTPETGAPRIEHFAFGAERLAEFLARLQKFKTAYRISLVPGLNLRQVNVYDPDGNHIEIAFAAGEEADLSDYSGA